MTELSRIGAPRRGRALQALQSTSKPRITVSWTRVERERGLSLMPAKLELTVSQATPQQTSWICLTPFAQNWLEIIASKPCSEVVLSGKLEDDPVSKHLVLELAERLTQELAASKPLIRVRFCEA